VQDAQAEEQIRDEFERVVSVVEEMTGLKSRWRGEVRVVQPQEQLFSHRQFTARKDWDCSFSIVATLTNDDARWRTIIHEALHSVSVGLNAQDYETYLGWEEATVEALQRLIRPSILARLGVSVEEALFVRVESTWRYEHYVIALRQIATEFPGVSGEEFFRTLLGVRLRDRKAYIFAWGRRAASDFEKFKRSYANASGHLSL